MLRRLKLRREDPSIHVKNACLIVVDTKSSLASNPMPPRVSIANIACNHCVHIIAENIFCAISKTGDSFAIKTAKK